MANSTKKTQRDFFNELLANPTITDEQKTFLEGRIAQLNKKSSSGKKQTATQIANGTLKDEIYANMVIDVEYTITDMIKQFECCAGFSNQKISALVNQLWKEKRIEKIESKRKSYFKRIA
jgi:hypothetical protein